MHNSIGIHNDRSPALQRDFRDRGADITGSPNRGAVGTQAFDLVAAGDINRGRVIARDHQGAGLQVGGEDIQSSRDFAITFCL